MRTVVDHHEGKRVAMHWRRKHELKKIGRIADMKSYLCLQCRATCMALKPPTCGRCQAGPAWQVEEKELDVYRLE